MHHLKIRVSVFLCSILMTAFGIDLITVASLGTSPISSVPLVVSLYTPWTFGQLTFVLNMAFIVLQIALLRRQFRPVELLQIAINFVFSAAIDFFMHAMAGLQGLNWPFSAALLVAGCATLAFGICIEVASQVLMVPGDGAVKAIAQTGKWRMGSTKVAFDSTMVTDHGHHCRHLVDPLRRPGDPDWPWRRHAGVGHARRALRQFLQSPRLFHRTAGPVVLG